jgi:4'-phosphopantetheinyl transferase
MIAPTGEALSWAGANVHAWTINLALPDAAAAELAGLLSPDEAAVADRFHFEHDRRRYAVTRGALRTLLAGYLGATPREIEFVYGPVGKPELAGRAGLHFNVSHSRELAVIAVARSRVGVDVERLEAKPSLPRLVARLFAPADAERWRALPAAEQTAAFYRSWTWKEAFLKATGRGFASSLDGFTLQLAPAGPLAAPAEWLGADEPSAWSFAQFEPGEGFVGAVALEGGELQLSRRDWRPDCEGTGR